MQPSEAIDVSRPMKPAIGTSTARPTMSRTVTTRSTVEVRRGSSSAYVVVGSRRRT